jgi:hypothetical protein
MPVEGRRPNLDHRDFVLTFVVWEDVTLVLRRSAFGCCVFELDHGDDVAVSKNRAVRALTLFLS